MSKLRFALIGCGNIARKHAHVLHDYLDEAEIGAFVDPDVDTRAGVLGQVRRPGFWLGRRDDAGHWRQHRRLQRAHAERRPLRERARPGRSTAGRSWSKSHWRYGSTMLTA